MRKLPLYSPSIVILALTIFMLENFHLSSANATIQSMTQQSPILSQEPQSTGTGTPPPNAVGTRRPLTSCPTVDYPPVALVYGRREDFTRLEHPTFWYYLPYRSEDIGTIEIVLRDESRQTIERYEVRSIDNSGLIKITLPYSLEVNKNYQVLFKIYCGNRQPGESNADIVLSTWVQRKPESAIDLPANLDPLQQYQLYRDERLWYDAIDTLADLHFSNPKNIEIRQAWKELLESLAMGETLPNLDWLDGEPLVDSELHPK